MGPEDRHDWNIKKLEQRSASRADDLALRLELAEAYFQKAYYFDAGDSWYDKARELSESVLVLQPRQSMALDLVAGCHYGLGNFDESEDAYLAALDANPEDALATVGMGNLHRQRGNLVRAIESFRHAVMLDADLWQAHYNLGETLHQDAKARDFRGADDLMEEAIYHLVTAIRTEPFPGFLGHAYKNLGELFLYTRQYEHAQRFFRKLVDHPEFGYIASFYLGLAYLSLNKPKNAIQHFRAFLVVEPDSAIAHSKIALCHLELEEFRRAREACEAALAAEPGNLMARFTQGCTAVGAGNHEDALADFGAILEEDPDYFPAYVEMVKARYLLGDYRWLFETLAAEIRSFETADGYDGGRRYYKGIKGRLRRRIDVLLAQIKEIGLPAFGSLSRMLQEIHTDSLRFQIWEDLYEMSREQRVRRVLEALQDADEHFGQRLGRDVLSMSHHIPEEAIIEAFVVEEDALKRRAHSLAEVINDVGAYAEALERARAECTQYQAYLLLSMAVKGTPTAEEFLLEYLTGTNEPLRNAAAIALLFYGNEQAVAMLESEAEEAKGEAREKLDELVQVGQVRREEKHKVIDLTAVAESRVVPQEQPRRRSLEDHETLHCSLCSRTQDQVDRLMSGNRVLLCNLCISAIHHHRDELAVPDDEEHSCQLCRRSIFEVQSVYRVGEFMICDICLDQCVRLLQREEVDNFLRDFS